MILTRLLSRKWIIATLLVMLGVGVLARLGIWQLDRLDQRRVFNARVLSQVDQPLLDLDANALQDQALIGSLQGMEYRQVTVTGEYDPAMQVALRNQAWNNHLGVQLLTPLHIQGTDQVILVERGWVPVEDFTAGRLGQYDEPGQVQVHGVIRRSETRPEIGRRSDPTPVPGGDRLVSYYLANVDRISAEMPYPLLAVYIQESPDDARAGPPYRSTPELDLSEGSHLSYAMQWFGFAAILGLGYPFYVRREEKREKPGRSEE